jgi:hypothetical protein
MAIYTQSLANLRATAEKLRAEHDKFCGWDGRLYNGGTVVILACDVAATVFSASVCRMDLLVAQSPVGHRRLHG